MCIIIRVHLWIHVLRYTLDFVPSVFFLSVTVCCRVLELVVVEIFACLFPEIMTRLIKIIHTACCEQLHFYQNHLDGWIVLQVEGWTVHLRKKMFVFPNLDELPFNLINITESNDILMITNPSKRSRRSLVKSHFSCYVITLIFAQTSTVCRHATVYLCDSHVGFVFLFSHPFIIILLVQIQGSMPPGTQAEGSDLWGDLAEGSQREMNIWLSSQPEFTDQQLTVKAPFGSHSRKHSGWLKICCILISQCSYWIQGWVRLWVVWHIAWIDSVNIM